MSPVARTKDGGNDMRGHGRACENFVYRQAKTSSTGNEDLGVPRLLCHESKLVGAIDRIRCENIFGIKSTACEESTYAVFGGAEITSSIFGKQYTTRASFGTGGGGCRELLAIVL